MLLVAAVQPLALGGARQVGLGGHGQGEEVLGVAPGDRLQLAGAAQLLPPELADRLQHREPRLAVGGLGLRDQALVHQRGEHVGRGRAPPGRRPPRPPPASSPRRTPPAGRTAAARRPGAGRSSRRWRRRVRWRAGRSRAPPVSSGSRRSSRASSCRGRSLGPGRRQLDGQRQPVEPAADLRHRRPFSLGQRRTPAAPPRPLDEQRDRLVLAGGLQVRGPAGSGSAAAAPRTPARPEDSGSRLVTRTVSPGAAASSSATTGAAAITCSKLSSTSSSRLSRRWSRSAARMRPGPSRTRRAGDGRGDQGGVGHRAPRAKRRRRGAGQQLGGDLEGQPGLAGAARAGEGEQPGPRQQPPGLGDLPLPAHERGELRREVAAASSVRGGGKSAGSPSTPGR